jgi:hypothetical protein
MVNCLENAAAKGPIVVLAILLCSCGSAGNENDEDAGSDVDTEPDTSTYTDTDTNVDTDMNSWTVGYFVVTEDSWGGSNVYGIEYNDNTGEDIWISTSPDTPWSHEFTTSDPDFPISIWARSMPCDGICEGFNATITISLYIDHQLYSVMADYDSHGSAETEISGNLSAFLDNGPIGE